MLNFFFSVATLSSVASIHPLHVSVCEIEYDADSKSLEIIQRIFLDDLETQIRKDRSQPELDITLPGGSLSTDQLVESYLQRRLQFVVNGKQVVYSYLGHEIEGDVIFCYIEIEKVKKLRSLRVQSSILSDVFEDQVNIVHVEVGRKLRSMKLTSRKREEEIFYD